MAEIQNALVPVGKSYTPGSKSLKDLWWGKVNPNLKTGFNWVKAHPGRAAGYGLLGGTNVAGLFDNNKIAGQLVGAGAGTALPFLLNNVAGTSFGVPGKIMFGLGGGALGSLFDKLMAKKEQEEQMAQQYQGQY